ncbi:unnamed protein product [Amoebophrya sp. A120]|nr:unnamed protein product [Amoebophrya sp. A120]|eukprot:GSA120T00008279001.1
MASSGKTTPAAQQTETAKTALRVFVSGLPDADTLPAAELQNFIQQSLSFRPKAVFWAVGKFCIQLKKESEVEEVVSFLDKQVYATTADEKFTLRATRAATFVVNEHDLSCALDLKLSKADVAGLEKNQKKIPVEEAILQILPEGLRSKTHVRSFLSADQAAAAGDNGNKAAATGTASSSSAPSSFHRLFFAKRAHVQPALHTLQQKFGKEKCILSSIVPQFTSGKSGRLIVRNLRFTAEEVHVRKAFSKFGELKEVSLPGKVKQGGDRKLAGVAFVEFVKREDAAKALEQMNGKEICKRPIAVDWCLGKDVYQQMQNSNRSVEMKVVDENQEKEAEAENSGTSRTSAQKITADENEKDHDSEEDAGSESDPDAEEEESDDAEDESQEHDDAHGDSKERPDPSASSSSSNKKTPSSNKSKRDTVEALSSDSEADSDEEDKGANESDSGDDDDRPKTELGKNAIVNSEEDKKKEVFVLNVPFDATKQDLEAAFARYGPVARVYLTPDHSKVNPHRGSCFVKFVQESAVDKVLGEEKRLQEKLREFGCKQAAAVGQGSAATKLDGFGLVVKGRRLIIRRLESREDVAQKSKKSLKEQRQAARNQYAHLHMLGAIEETAPEFKELTKQEQQLRKQSLQEKKFKLKDPNYIVNPKRLVLKNLDLQLDSAAIKEKVAIVMAALEKSREEKKAEEERNAEDASASSTKVEKKTKKKKIDKLRSTAEDPQDLIKPHLQQVSKAERHKQQNKIATVNLMRSSDRKTADGVRRSLGYAFVEFKNHTDALDVLKLMNNNPKLQSIDIKKRLLVEFSFDDKRALRTQELAKKRKDEKLAAAKRRREDGEAEDGQEGERGGVASTSGGPTAKKQKGEGKKGSSGTSAPVSSSSSTGKESSTAEDPSEPAKKKQKTKGGGKGTTTGKGGSSEGNKKVDHPGDSKDSDAASSRGPKKEKKLSRGQKQRMKRREERAKAEQAAKPASAVTVKKQGNKNEQRRETVKQAKIAEKRALRKAQKEKERQKHAETDDLEEKYMRGLRR